jgi:hypothetical protein
MLQLDLMSTSQLAGKRQFNPASPATRQDVMFTIARALNLTDASESELSKFQDWRDVSPQLRPKIAAVVQAGVIQGSQEKGEWYLKPMKNLTRAECMKILYTATQSDVKNIIRDYPEDGVANGSTFVIRGETDPGARVWVKIDNRELEEEAEVDDNGVYTSKPIQVNTELELIRVAITAMKGSATNPQTKVVKVIPVGSPTITIINYPQTTDKSSVKITGKVSDANMDSLMLFCADATIPFDKGDGKFEATVDLKNYENTFIFKAVNKQELTSTQLISIVNTSKQKPGNPTITLHTDIPAETTSDFIRVNGQASNVKLLYVDDNAQSIGSDGVFSFVWNLSDGKNTKKLKAFGESGEPYEKTLSVVKGSEVNLPSSSNHAQPDWTLIGKYPNSTKTYNGHQYVLFEYSSTWDDARLDAIKLGGTLATVTTGNEQRTIENLLRGAPTGTYFLGGTDQAIEGIWTWLTGETWGYENWRTSTNEPNNSGGNEHYLHIYNNADAFGKWNDVNASNQQTGFIVEWDYTW